MSAVGGLIARGSWLPMNGHEGWKAGVSAHFRWFGYPAAALLAMTLIWDVGPPAGAVIAASAFAIAPFFFSRLPPAHAWFECLITGVVAGFTGMPEAWALAVLGALAIALTARDGPARGALAAVVAGIGWGSGRLLSPLPPVTGDAVFGALSVLFVLLLCVPISSMAFRSARRRQRQNTALRTRADGLRTVAGALAAYLPEPVGSRLFAMEFDPVLERRWVTVCFVDLAGFTALVDRLAPESVVELLHEFSVTMLRLVRAHDGVLDKLMGDGVLMFFEARRADERAVAARACMDLLGELGAAIDTLGHRWRSMGLVEPLRVRCGVASGYCSVGDIGDSARRHYTVVGGPVNLASRLQQLARLDSAILDGVTASVIERDGLMAVGSRNVKGLPQAVDVFSLPLRTAASRPRSVGFGAPIC